MSAKAGGGAIVGAGAAVDGLLGALLPPAGSYAPATAVRGEARLARAFLRRAPSQLAAFAALRGGDDDATLEAVAPHAGALLAAARAASAKEALARTAAHLELQKTFPLLGAAAGEAAAGHWAPARAAFAAVADAAEAAAAAGAAEAATKHGYPPSHPTLRPLHSRAALAALAWARAATAEGEARLVAAARAWREWARAATLRRGLAGGEAGEGGGAAARSGAAEMRHRAALRERLEKAISEEAAAVKAAEAATSDAIAAMDDAGAVVAR